MKKTWIIGSGMLILSGAIYLSSRLMAQPGAGAPHASTQTRIALFNLNSVVKGYMKYQVFQDDIKGLIKKYQETDKGIRGEIEKYTKGIENPTSPPEHKEAWAKEIKKLQRQLEDNSTEAKATLGKKSDEQMVILYKEIQEMAGKVATSQGIELVLHFNDAPANTPEWSNPVNVARKMQAGACMPVHVAPGMDISDQLVNALNGDYKAKNPSAATPTTAAAH